MRMPYTERTDFRKKTQNPFSDATEMDILSLTKQVLNDNSCSGYVTSDGKVMPRNDAFRAGKQDGIELVKERVWG